MQRRVKVNNELYEIYGDRWWNEDAEFDFASLRYCVNPVRYGYFKRKLQHLRIPAKAVLDVGCGGGFLAEEFAKDGFQVTGIDPSAKSVATARKHAAESGLNIKYEVGRGEAMPFADGSFDLVACCDVLEHVDDLEMVIREVSRLLKPRGVFFYDTVNRTWLSKIALIKIWQDWSFTRCSPANSHVWEKFIKPAELIAIMQTWNLTHREIKGIAPRRRNFLVLLRHLRAVKTGKMRNEEMATALQLGETEDLRMAYMGYAVRRP
ncbi:MAG TPA: bifunctional 2-polyprenyl-6-hydroxyphenol methylase/3-demethylubiquinol 3-O-methyltransferase UbiG [Syntrophobacteraceae bacterium]|nr:bifunctional 2-polyprenyl-6-hydroxyphenol methylase/3-demethylubiquinol 3-O-methyltransferase UbiG [Syntrophobacteraceae bacterium]